MKVKFTKRSAKDKTLVTATLAQFDNTELDASRHNLFPGDEMIMVIEGVPTIFTLARPDKDGHPTAAVSHTYPRFLRLPRVGRPVYAEVSEVR